MKRIFLGIFLFSGMHSFAQAPLAKGKTVSITTVTEQTINMGMEMTANSSTLNKVQVLDADAKNYTLSNTITKLVFSGNMMGKETNFDSDKPADRETEEGKQFSSMVDKTDTVMVDAATGMVADAPIKKTGDEPANPMAGMMSSMVVGGGGTMAASVLFKIPGAITKGKVWTDSSTVDKMKNVTTYTITDVANGVATVTSTGTINGTSSMEMMGQSMDISMDTKTTGSIMVDTKTFLVKTRTNVADVSASIDAGGQTIPFTTKATSTSTYQ